MVVHCLIGLLLIILENEQWEKACKTRISESSLKEVTLTVELISVENTLTNQQETY